MSLADALGQALVGAVNPFYRDGVLSHTSRTDDGAGGGTVITTDELCRVQVDDYNSFIRSQNGYADTDVRLLILNNGIAPVADNDRVTVLGKTYSMIGVRQDPARSYFEARGVRWSGA